MAQLAESVNRRVCPSASAPVTALVPMTCEAPGRLSMNTLAPHICARRWPITRAITSGATPAVAGTTMRIGLEGNCWARASPAASSAVEPSAEINNRRLEGVCTRFLKFIFVSWWFGFCRY